MEIIKDYNVPIKYTKNTTTVLNYETGISDWLNIDTAYRGQFLRNKVVCRFDAAYFLRKYFEPKTIEKYRLVLLMIAKGKIEDPKQFSDVILQLINDDKVFAEEIVNLYHSCPEEQAFGYHIIRAIADVFKNVESDYRTFFRGRPEVVICVSDGYLYFSFEDADEGPLLRDKLECEVLSYAKNWRGKFRYFSTTL